MQLFGTTGSDAAGVSSSMGTWHRPRGPGLAPAEFAEGVLRLVPEAELERRPRRGPAAAGGARSAASRRRSRGSSPSTRTAGAGVEDVYAAGDITAFPVKQGGIAAQQAEAAAESIAADAGADSPGPFRPVLRGLLLTGRSPASPHRSSVGRGTSGEPGAALVAALEDRRPLPLAVPRRFRRSRSPPEPPPRPGAVRWSRARPEAL